MKVNFNPEKYMKLAVEVMRNSIQEPRNDKSSPKVGAVLVTPAGEVIGTAFRGELRDGDHAEFTLLERKNRSVDLTGCFLFATLEPCAPGARRHPKLGCAERIVNARIAKVWIGIEDPDPTVDRKGIKYLEDNHIEVFMFPPELQKEIREENEEFLKQALERAKDESAKEKVTLNELENEVANTDLSAFSIAAIEYYIDKAGLSFDAKSDEFVQHLLQIELIKLSGGKYIPTGVGILLFGKDPRATYQNAVIKAKVKYGSNKPIPSDFEGPLVLIPQRIELWLQQVLHSQVNRDQFERQTQTLFPIEPLREAIINALVHRDYEIEGAKTYIDIDDDRIIIKSVGLPVSPISLEQVKKFRAPSLSRNPKITYIFNKLKLMEESELGMETFRTMQEKHGMPLPAFEYADPYLLLTFPRSTEALKREVEDITGTDLSYEEIRGYELVKSKGSISRKEYAEYFDFDDRKAGRQLKHLKDLNLIGDNGESPKANGYRYVYIHN